MYNDYYVPRTKQSLVLWFAQHMGYNKSSLNKMHVKKLLAIYHKARQRISSSMTELEVHYELST